MKVKATSTTFDDPTPSRLTKVGHARRHKRIVRLKLTQAGRAAISSCEARQIQVRAGKQRRGIDLVRNSAGCAPKPIDLSRAADCDFIGQQQGSLCLLPFPDDYYTTPDPSTATGRRIDFHAAAMPANAGGTPIDPAPYLRNDGFSPGQGIVLKVPGLDTAAAQQQTGAAPLNHLGRYSEPDAPVVVIDAATGQRQPIWVEIDSNASTPAATALEIHPAVNFASGHRYIVALRNLKDGAGQPIAAPEGFRYYRDQLPSNERPDQRPALPLRVDLHDAAQRGDPPLEPLPRLGLHRRQRREHRRARAAHAQRRLRVAGRQHPWQRVDGRHRAGLPGHPGRRLHPRRRSRDRAPSPRHLHRPLLPAAGLRPGRQLPARRRRAAQPQHRQRLDGELRLHHPAHGDRRAHAGARPSRRSTGTGCSEAPREVFNAGHPAGAGQHLRVRSLRDRRDRDVGW